MVDRRFPTRARFSYVVEIGFATLRRRTEPHSPASFAVPGGLILIAVTLAGCYRGGPPAIPAGVSNAVPPNSPVVGFGADDARTRSGATYVGAEACRACHSEHVELSAHNHMAQSARRLSASHRDGWFRSVEPNGAQLADPVRWPKSEGPPPRILLEGDRVVFESTPGPSPARRADVAVVLGSGTRAVTPVSFEPGPSIRELRLTHLTERGEWIMTPGSGGDPHPLGYARSPEFSRDCLECHSTVLTVSGDRFDPASSAFGVECERCHGPGSVHLAAVAGGAADWGIFNPGHLTPADSTRFCAGCHRRPADMEPERVMEARPTLARHAGASLMLSACFRKSPPERTISCLDCHDPHRNVGETSIDPDRSCQRCHTDVETAHEDVARSADSGCVNCHMPVERRALAGLEFRSHWIRVAQRPPPGRSADAAAYTEFLEREYLAAIDEPNVRPEKKSKLRVRLGKLLCSTGRTTGGLRWLRDALTHSPLYKDRLLAAELHRRSGDAEAARRILEGAIEAEPRNNYAYRDLARLHAEAGDFAAAETVLDRWEAARPNDPHLRSAREDLHRIRRR